MARNFAASFPTEEAFVRATFCEFVKLWGNGSQAHLQVQCLGGHAWVQLMSALGPPSSPHLYRQDDLHHHHGYHGPHQSQRKRKRGAKQKDRDRARATLHRASLLDAAAAQAAAPETLHHAPQPLPHPSPLHTCQEYHPRHTVPPPPVPEYTHHDCSTPQFPVSPHSRRSDRTRAGHGVHRRMLGLGSPGITDKPENLLLTEVSQVVPPRAGLPADAPPHRAGLPAIHLPHRAGLPANALPPRAGLPAEDLPHKAGLPAEEGNPDDLPLQEASPADPQDPPVHITTPSYSSVARIFSKPPARPSDHPASPAGWGAVDPTRAEGGDSDSDSEEHVYDSKVNDSKEHVNVADLSSFYFLSSEPSPHLPPSSSRGRQTTRLNPTYYLNRIRKPVKHLKVSLNQNIERAVFNRPAGSTVWVWEVSVKRDFEEHMVWDHTSFHGCSYTEEYEEYDNQENTFGKNEQT